VSNVKAVRKSKQRGAAINSAFCQSNVPRGTLLETRAQAKALCMHTPVQDLIQISIHRTPTHCSAALSGSGNASDDAAAAAAATWRAAAAPVDGRAAAHTGRSRPDFDDGMVNLNLLTANGSQWAAGLVPWLIDLGFGWHRPGRR